MVKFVLKVLCTWMPETPKAYFVDTPSMRILRSACSYSAKGLMLSVSARLNEGTKHPTIVPHLIKNCVRFLKFIRLGLTLTLGLVTGMLTLVHRREFYSGVNRYF